MPGVDVVYASEVERIRSAGDAGRRPPGRGRDRVQTTSRSAAPLRLDGAGRARRRHAPQHVVEHHRGAARRHRDVPDRAWRRPPGRKATAVGKPAPEGFLASASRLGVDPEEMYMVGDDLNNDVLAAQVVGMTGVLVRTGKFRQDTLDRWAADEFAMQPNHVIDSVADLPGLLGICMAPRDDFSRTPHGLYGHDQ